MLNNLQLRKLIIQPVLKTVFTYDQKSEDLLVGTVAQESRGGSFLFQQGTNPDLFESLQKNILAVGIYQMEPKTHDDLWKNYLNSHKELSAKIISFCKIPENPTADIMLYNLYYATAMARTHYLRVKDPIPDTLLLQAQYYKKYYNTSGGSATVTEYINNFNIFNGVKNERQ